MTIQPEQARSGFVDSIRASQSRTACCLFIVILSVVVIFILIFAHQEFGVIEEKHYHHTHPELGPSEMNLAVEHSQ